jgi:hypothetical protein
MEQLYAVLGDDADARVSALLDQIATNMKLVSKQRRH